MPEGPPQSNRTATTAENVIFRILKSCRNRGSHFLQFTGLWLNCGKSTTLLQLRSIKFDCVEIAPQLVTVRGHPTKLQTHPVQLGQTANRRSIDHHRIVWNFKSKHNSGGLKGEPCACTILSQSWTLPAQGDWPSPAACVLISTIQKNGQNWLRIMVKPTIDLSSCCTCDPIPAYSVAIPPIICRSQTITS